MRSSPRRITPEKRNIGRSHEKCSRSNRHPSFRAPSRDEMRAVFLMCRGNQWDSVLNSIRSNHLIPTTNMTMDNNISTTILHQAITSKGDIKKRARVIQEVLRIAPLAASIKNGYGSLPLHVISQRNTKMDSKTKEILIRDIMDAYPESLTQHGGVGMRTPLHIIFTDYISPGLTATMIQYGRRACFMRDKKGFLPAHVACSRHCSPEKLEMLLEVNSSSLFAKTDDGRTLLVLAKNTATKSHPNYALISEIERRVNVASMAASPSTAMGQLNVQTSLDYSTYYCNQGTANSDSNTRSAMHNIAPIKRQSKLKRKRKVTIGDDETQKVIKQEDISVKQEDIPIKQEESEPANLLLHFSRHTENLTSV